MRVNDIDAARGKHALALERNLISILEQLRAMPKVHKVILFGSYAAGRRDLFTDLDIIVVMDSALDFVTRGADMARRVRAGVALDLLVYTPEELDRVQNRPFFRHALQTGKVLYEKCPLS